MKHFIRAIFLFVFLSLPQVAVADGHKTDQCKSDSDCEKGMTCVEIDISEPQVVSVSTDCVCAEGDEDCDCEKAPDKKEEPKTEPTKAKKVKRCAPKNCKSNNDCGDSKLKCVAIEDNCDDVAIGGVPDMPCPEGEECPKPKPSEKKNSEKGECVPDKICVPKWMGPCKSNNDCAQGTTCECKCGSTAQGSSGSSSSGSTPTPSTPGSTDEPDGDEDDGGSTPSPDPGKADNVENCDCGVAECKGEQVECTSDSSCKFGWKCQENPLGPMSTKSDCSPEQEDCKEESQQAAAKKYCLPPNFKAWLMALVSMAGGTSNEVTLGSTSKGGGTDTDSAASAPEGSSSKPVGERTGGPATGCQSGSSPVTLLPLFALIGLLAVMRRRKHSSATE